MLHYTKTDRFQDDEQDQFKSDITILVEKFDQTKTVEFAVGKLIC